MYTRILITRLQLVVYIYESKVYTPGFIPVLLFKKDKPNIWQHIFSTSKKKHEKRDSLDQFLAGEEFRSPWQLGIVWLQVALLRSKMLLHFKHMKQLMCTACHTREMTSKLFAVLPAECCVFVMICFLSVHIQTKKERGAI